MDITLTRNEARVIGSLIEKEVTTPEHYPLSLNALTSACNQKSNREPVLHLAEAEVQQTVDGLVKKHLVTDKTGFGSRVVKYRHRFCNTEFGPVQFSAQELGIMCVLLLRGPQTPGELRSRTGRLCQFAEVREVEATLGQLMERGDGPFVMRLPRQAGKRESRYAHLFCGPVEDLNMPGDEAVEAISQGPDDGRLDRLEALVSELRKELEQLKDRLEQLVPQQPSGNP